MEWPERAGDTLPSDAIHIRIQEEAAGRRIGIDGPSEPLERIARSLRIRDFLDSAGLGTARRRFLMGDASARIYETIRTTEGPTRLVMTVHAAKGLEAPIVFLVDSGGKPAEAAHLPKLQEMPLDETVGALPPALLWVAGKSSENATTQGLKERFLDLSEEEYRRLLYVGMTRAADRLILCGYHGLKEPAYQHWHKLVAEALGTSAAGAPQGFHDLASSVRGQSCRHKVQNRGP